MSEHHVNPSAGDDHLEVDPYLASQARRETNARSYPRRIPIAIAKARGVEVTDTQGKTYLDCLAGAGALPLGHNHPVAVEAIRRALDEEVPFTTLDLTTPTKERFVDELFASLPASFQSGRIQFCGPSGADAVEASIKLAKTATGRTGVVAFSGAYHGMTQGTLALTSARGSKAQLGALQPDVHHLPFPMAYRCPFGLGGDASGVAASNLFASMLSDDHAGFTLPAAVIMEPVQGEGGVHPAPVGFARRVAMSTAAHGVPLIFDEVQTGLGRTGSLWAFEQLGVEPDILVLSKAIGGGLPVAVVVYKDEPEGWGPGSHAGTFRGNQLGLAVGAATIAYVRDNDLAGHARIMGERLMDGATLATKGIDQIGEVRGRGLMVGIEIVDPDHVDVNGVPSPDGTRARRIQAEMLQRGVICEVGGRGGAVVRFLPPLIIDAEGIDRVLTVFDDAVRAS